MYAIKFEDKALIVATGVDFMNDPHIRTNDSVHLGDWAKGGTGLFISASLSRGQLYELAGYNVSKIDFAVPQEVYNKNTPSVWSYEDGGIFGKQIFDHEARKRFVEVVVQRIRSGEGVKVI